MRAQKSTSPALEMLLTGSSNRHLNAAINPEDTAVLRKVIHELKRDLFDDIRLLAELQSRAHAICGMSQHAKTAPFYHPI